MKSEIKIRSAEFKDAELIFQLIKRHPEALLARPIGDIVQNIDRFLVSEINDKIVGTVSWQILPEIGSPKDPSVEIKSLVVDGHHQKAGVGRALVSQAIRRIVRLQPQQIIALTFSPGFFRKFGFRTVAKKRLMHKIYAGCINCTRYDSPFTCPEIAMALPMKKVAKETKPSA